MRFLFLLAVFALSISEGFPKEYKIGETYFGFKLIQKKFVKEAGAECLFFEHTKSGARLFKIASKDPNRTFSIAFKTDPESDCGTPHIMEHSVLNGSKKYPVKSPFDIISKGSLNTFINAFTGNDFTCYPFASMNEKDFFNLLGIYLDAVFNPLIYSDKRILDQEGWHHEMIDEKSPMVYKGVVYNEMKGAFSSPTRELNYKVYQALFPDNGYKFSSGGYPSAIPALNYEMFLNYHRKYYHPANGHILLYGNGALDKELEFIDKEYLSKYTLATKPVSFPIQKPFKEIKDIDSYYSVTEGSETNDQTYLSYNIVAGKNTDRATTMALNILSDLLVNQEAAPIRLALMEAGIGKEVSAEVDELQQNVFTITVQNANQKDKPKFLEIIKAELKKILENGLDKKAIEGAINRVEFRLREGNDAQKGISYNFQILPGWMFADDPYLTLEYEKPLSVLKSSLNTNYLEKVIEKELLNNKHAVLIAMMPKPGLEKELSEKTSKELENFKASLKKDDIIKVVKETKDLMEYQQREDSPEAIATIPTLERKDINPKSQYYEAVSKKIGGVPALVYNDFTNNVVYLRLLFDARVLSKELIPYAGLLSAVLGSQNTINYSYGDLDNEMNIKLGGFSTFLNSYLENQDEEKMMPKFVVDAKVMQPKTDGMAELINEILLHTKYNDVLRLKEILVRLQSRLESQVKQNGYGVAMNRFNSYITNSGKFTELTSGLDYYRFVTKLVENFDRDGKEVAQNLEKTARLLFNRNNMIICFTSEKESEKSTAEKLEKLTQKFPAEQVKLNMWNYAEEQKNEGFTTASKVQYVFMGYDFKKLGYKWDGNLQLLSKILSTDYLQTKIRVMGGAYGGFSSVQPNGVIYFSSYRDPNLKETIENYKGIPGYLAELKINEEELTRYIIGTIADIDNPLTTSQKGTTAFRNYLEKKTLKDLQKQRESILKTRPDDIIKMKKMLEEVISKNVLCVYGNEEKVKTHKELFKSVEQLKK